MRKSISSMNHEIKWYILHLTQHIGHLQASIFFTYEYLQNVDYSVLFPCDASFLFKAPALNGSKSWLTKAYIAYAGVIKYISGVCVVGDLLSNVNWLSGLYRLLDNCVSIIWVEKPSICFHLFDSTVSSALGRKFLSIIIKMRK